MNPLTTITFYTEIDQVGIQIIHTLVSSRVHCSFNSTKLQYFRLVQIESICIRQNNSGCIYEICFVKGRKHCGKRRKCWLPAFSPFLTIFLKASFTGSYKVGTVWEWVNSLLRAVCRRN